MSQYVTFKGMEVTEQTLFNDPNPAPIITQTIALEDSRKTALKKGLNQLTNEQINRLLNWHGAIVLDDCNYKDGNFCPLAIAVGLTEMDEPTDKKVVQALEDMGYTVYNTRGIQGNFYNHPNRYRDLRIAAQEILNERTSKEI